MPTRVDSDSDRSFFEEVARAQHEFVRLLARCIAKRILRKAEVDASNQKRAKKTSDSRHKT